MTNGKWGKWFSVSSRDSLPSSPTMGRWMGDDGLISEEMDLSKVAHRSEYRIVVAAQYRIRESDMHPDLEWLARNVSEWPTFGGNSEPSLIYRFYDIDGNSLMGRNHPTDTINGTEYTKRQWQDARQQLGLTTLGISDEGEEECLNLAHERISKAQPNDKAISRAVAALNAVTGKGLTDGEGKLFVGLVGLIREHGGHD